MHDPVISKRSHLGNTRSRNITTPDALSGIATSALPWELVRNADSLPTPDLVNQNLHFNKISR
jgi:hypothetical protein